MSVLRGLERSGRARGEQGQDDVVGRLVEPRIGFGRLLGKAEQIRADRIVAKSVDGKAARSAWLGPWIIVVAPIFSIIALCSSSESRPFSGVRTSPAFTPPKSQGREWSPLSSSIVIALPLARPSVPPRTWAIRFDSRSTARKLTFSSPNRSAARGP